MFYKLICLLLMFSACLNAFASSDFSELFGKENEVEYIGQSGLWVKTPLSTVDTPVGKAQGQVISRYFRSETTFKLGTITYYTYPRHSEKEKQDSLKVIRENLEKLFPEHNLKQEKIDDNLWAFTSEWKKNTRFVRVFYYKGQNTFTLITRLAKSRYLESTNMEGEWISRTLVKRAKWFDEKNESKKTSYTFGFNLIDEAYAQMQMNPQLANCPPPAPGGTVLPTTCPTPAGCAAILNPVTKSNCYATVQTCHINALNSQMSGLNGTMTGTRTDINCQSALWGRRVNDLMGYGDAKQVWVDQSVLPMAQDINGNIGRGIDLGEKVTNVSFIAATAAAGAAAATIASAGAALLVEGIASGLSALYAVVSGKNEEERRTNEAEAFLEAKQQWDDLEKKVADLEESLSTTVDIFGLISTSGKDLESLIAETDKNKEDLEFELDNKESEYDSWKKLRNDEKNQACGRELFREVKDLKAQLGSFDAILKSLTYAKSKHGNLGNFCEELASDINKLLGKEYLLEKLRNKLSMYYASHLWVEQKEAEKDYNEKVGNSTPDKLRDTEIDGAKKSFYANISEPTIDAKLGDKYNCKKVIEKASNECRSQNQSWATNIPVFGMLFGAKKSLRACSASEAGRLNEPKTMYSSKQNPRDFKNLVEFYERKISTKEIYDMNFDENELACIRGLIKNYNIFNKKLDSANMNYKNAIRTWNYRRSRASFELEYSNDIASLVRKVNLESACANISEDDCFESDVNCQKLKEEDCSVSELNVICANIPNKKYCNGYISKACANDDKPSSYCDAQKSSKKLCLQNVAECKRKKMPLGCVEIEKHKCQGMCAKYDKSCYDSGREKSKACKKAKLCMKEQKSCVEKMTACSKSAFSNIRFRFGKLKGMRDYLKDYSCKQFKGRSF